jgi:hypothetical protein
VSTKNEEALRDLMQKHHLTYANVAALAGRSIKTVERWLATPGTVSFSPMPDNALSLVRLSINAQKKPRKARRKA